MIPITEEQTRKYAPKAIPEYLEAFRNGKDVLDVIPAGHASLPMEMP